MTEEELLICCIELRNIGYRYFYRFPCGRDRWSLRASRYTPLSRAWYGEPLLELAMPADLARVLQAATGAGSYEGSARVPARLFHDAS